MNKKIFLLCSLLIGFASFSRDDSFSVEKDGDDNYIIEIKKGKEVPGDATHKEQKIEKGKNNIIYGRLNFIKQGDDEEFCNGGGSERNLIKGDDNEISMTSDSYIMGDSNNIYGVDEAHIVGKHNIIKVNNKEDVENKNKKSSRYHDLAYGNRNEIYNSNDSYTFGNNNEIHRSFNSMAIGNKNVIKRTYLETDKLEPQNTPESNYSFAFGDNNKLIDSCHSESFGSDNEINDSKYSLAVGMKNKISESQYSFAQGADNKINKESHYSAVFGNENEISESWYSFAQGNKNSVKNSENSLVQGSNSSITNSKNSAIIGGYFSRVNMANSVAIGSYSNTIEIKNVGYLTNQSTNNVYALAVGGEYKGKDENGNEQSVVAKRRIQGLADGAEDDEAVTVAQLKKVSGKTEVALNKAELALGGISNAVAMANLVQVNSYSRHRHNLSAAYGYYGGSHALAIGFSGVNEKRNFVYKLSGSVNNHGNLALGLGVGVMLGKEDNDYPVNSKKVSMLEKDNKELKEKVSKLERMVTELLKRK